MCLNSVSLSIVILELNAVEMWDEIAAQLALRSSDIF